MDFAVSLNNEGKLRESEKKYLNLDRELNNNNKQIKKQLAKKKKKKKKKKAFKLWNMRVIVVPLVGCVLGMVPEGIEKAWKNWKSEKG